MHLRERVYLGIVFRVLACSRTWRPGSAVFDGSRAVLTCAYVAWSEVFAEETRRMAVEVRGATQGRTWKDGKGSSVKVLSGSDTPLFWRRLLQSLSGPHAVVERS
jgi:inosine-uridine nucleoside N-ribohydrolase